MKTKHLLICAFLLLVVSQLRAQSTADSSATSSGMVKPKVFGGMSQYKTFSLGINGGITSESLATGGTQIYNHKQLDFGFGASAREQFSHTFGVQLDVHGGTVKADNFDVNGVETGNFSSKFWAPTLSGVFNFANISWLHRQDFVNLYATGGAGLVIFQAQGQLPTGQGFYYPNFQGSTSHWAKDMVIPIGVGAKFKISDVIALNLGYTENFIDGSNFDDGQAVDYIHQPFVYGHASYAIKSHYSYGYAGLEFTLGSRSKPNLDWVNPVALMYDELYDAALRAEVEALKKRVTNVQNAINDLKKDSDGDGVSDQFDKCPNTPAGTVVDGAGCPINFPPPPNPPHPHPIPYTTIQFEFDSSVITTASYPALDASSSDLRANSGKVYEVAGFASAEGTAAHNLRLSKDRATSVKVYLVNSGVSEGQLKVKGFGTKEPIGDNKTEAGRIINRRVEFRQK